MAYATNSLGNYSGTIVASPIRPAGPNNLIATVFSNEIKGAHHHYETLSERNSIPESRRDWGMLVTIYNDGTTSNNKTYQLKYGQVDTNLTNNSNWVDYSPSGVGGGSTKWIDNVSDWINFPTSFIDGVRYLVKPTGQLLFSGNDNKIAIWNAGLGSFNFIDPIEGQTLRVDSIKNVLFKYQNGVWVQEYLNSVRYLLATSNDGLTYSAISQDQNSVGTYSFSVFYVNFSTQSSGTAFINIDGLGFQEIKKLENNTLNSIESGDIQSGIQYQLTWNGSSFQTTLPSSSVTTIGPAEDGDYTDGLYTDFTTTTPIGTAVDRFNEIFKALVPPSAPNLTSWSATGSFVNGNISFDNSTSGGNITATSSPYGVVTSGGSFNQSGFRLGITSRFLQPQTGTQFFSDIYGVLNSSVLQNSQTPTPAFITASFGNGATGSLHLFLNGVTISSINLSSTMGSTDSTNGGATSGLSISSATSSKFPTGFNFDTFINRTGTWMIKRDDSRLVNGYNFAIVRHDLQSGNLVLNRYEWIADGFTGSVSVTNPQIQSTTTTNQNHPTKWLSGIQYWTKSSSSPLNLVYSVDLGNVFRNTYNGGNNAITYLDRSSALSGSTNSVTNTVTTSSLGNIFTAVITSGPLIPSGVINPTQTMNIVVTFSLDDNKRRINDNVGFGIQVLRTVQGTFSGGTSSLTGLVSGSNWFIDSYGTASTNTTESFIDEGFRITNGSSRYDSFSDTVSGILSATWSSESSLNNGGIVFQNGLQVVNGRLVYPKFPFDSTGTSQTNPNFGKGVSRQYNNCNTNTVNGFGTQSGNQYRSYTRRFRVSDTTNFNKALLSITSSNVNFINTSSSLSAQDLWIEIKIPGQTGWMDPTKSFDSGRYENGDGCLEGNIPPNHQNWLINFGVKNTVAAGGWILLRITSNSSWVGNISNITLTGRN